MVNALFSSREDGTKLFMLEGNHFGWDTIIGMYKQECELRNDGRARMVPKLRAIYAIRDSRTKLNVLLAKIMQILDQECSRLLGKKHYSCVCVHVYVCSSVHVYVCSCVHVYVCLCVHVYVCSCVHVYVCA